MISRALEEGGNSGAEDGLGKINSTPQATTYAGGSERTGRRRFQNGSNELVGIIGYGVNEFKDHN